MIESETEQSGINSLNDSTFFDESINIFLNISEHFLHCMNLHFYITCVIAVISSLIFHPIFR